ncbi:MAG: tyrosine-protein phosphatase [Bacteroidales bacterium]|nr:tyrosine-protein phosphatase [Bacteroidales bacterium]
MKQLLTTLLLVSFVYLSCGKPAQSGFIITPPASQPATPQKPETPPDNAPQTPPEDSKEDAILATNPYVQKFLEEVNYPCTNNPDTDKEYAYSSVVGYPGGGPSENNIEIPPVYTISWTASASDQKLMVREGSWSREYSLKGGVGSQTITNLVPGTTYNWQVTTSSDEVVAQGSFDTRGLLHQVFFQPNVRNGRDLGGYKGLGGKTVAYHKLYRGGRIDKKYCNETGREEMLAEGIKAEVDLREASDVPSGSPLGGNVDFYAPGFDSGYNHMVRDNPEKVKNTFCWVVARLRENKPVYFHCAAGRDRTATLAVLLEGALGVSESDMAKDYELTYFSPADWGMSTDDDGKPAYKHVRTAYSYKSVRKTIFSQTDSGTYQERIAKYLLKIGVPQKDIDDLRNIMLE